MTIDDVGRRRRGRLRAVVATAVLLAWAGGVGLVARRAATRSDADRLAEAALRLAPGTTYLIVEQDGRTIGYASTTIDTTRSTVVVTDQFAADLPVGGQTIAASATAAITLSRGLALRSFDVRVETPVQPERPIANAGPNVDTLYRQLTLDGSKSSDPAGGKLTYLWRPLSKTAVVLEPTSVTPRVQLGEQFGPYLFELTVTNEKGVTASSTVTVNFVSTRVF